MKVWRKLIKAGAVQLKGSVYILPFSDDHYEFLQWLVSEIAEMKGEGTFTRIEHIDTMKDSEIIGLFNRQRANDYRAIETVLDDLERRLSSIRKGGKAQNIQGLSEQFGKLLKEFEEVKKIDFFFSKEGVGLKRKNETALQLRSRNCQEQKQRRKALLNISSAAVDAYQGKYG